MAIPETSPPHTAADNATESLNSGYEAFLADENDLWPASEYCSTFCPIPSTSDAQSDQSSSQSPASMPDSSPSSSETSETSFDSATSRHSTQDRNDAIVTLEHEAFLAVNVQDAKKLKGISPIDFWRVGDAVILHFLPRLLTVVLQARAGDLPLVYQLALDVLPSQASSVSSERVFSSSKMTCTQSRNRISTGTVEALQILKHSLRQRTDVPLSSSSSSLDFMARHTDDAWGDSLVSSVSVD